MIAEDLRHGRRDRVEDVRFPEGFQLQVGTLQGVSFTNCVLWLTLGGGMFRGGVMEDCRFVDVDLDPFTMYKAEMRDTSFEHVVFGVRAMGGIDDTQIEDVTFADCRILDYGFRKTHLTRVRIDGGRMDRVRFDVCRFTDVGLASPMKDVTMRDCSFERSDIRASDVIDVTLMDWREPDLRLPDRRTGFFVTPAAVTEVLTTMVADLSGTFSDHIYRHVVMAGYDLVAISERFLMSELGASPVEASAVVDALYPHRLEALSEARQAVRSRG